MKLSETSEIVEEIYFSYPGSFRNMNLERMVEVWHVHLNECNFELAKNKLREYISENKFPPSISDIKSGTKEKQRIGEEEARIIAELRR